MGTEWEKCNQEEKQGQEEVLGFDEVLRRYVGECGRYQATVCLLLSLVAISNAFYVLDVLFVAAAPADHRCDVITNGTSIVTSQALVSAGRCTVEGNLTFARDQRDEGTLEEGVPCTRWRFEDAAFKDTIVKQWSLVCGRSWLVACVHSAFLAGTLVGVLSGGFLSDRYGRKPVLVGFASAALLFRVALAFSPSVEFFITFRFLIGLTNLDTFTCAFVLGTELVGPSWRVTYGTLLNLVWAAGYMLVPGLTYALRDTSWSTLTLILTACCTYVLLYFCAVPESPRWQLSQGQTDAAMRTLRRMAKVNKRHLPENVSIKTETEEKDKDEGKVSVLILAKSSTLRWRSLIVLYIWFAAAMVYYGLCLGVGDLAGSLYINTFIMGAVEVPAYFLCQQMLSRRPGRRGSTCILFASCAGVLLASCLVPKGMPLVMTVLAMVGKLGVSAAFLACYVITAELYPTAVRQVALGVAATVGRVGGTIAPFIGHLTVYHASIPIGLFGLLSLVAAGLTLFLPETRNQPLPLTMADVQRVQGPFCKRTISESDVTTSEQSGTLLQTPENQVTPGDKMQNNIEV